MADKSLRARLSRLFATNVVVRRIAKNRLKAVDTNRLQSTGNMTNKRYVDRFSGVQDQYGCAMGGLKVISMKKNEIKISKISNHKLQSIIENNSILYDTKKNRKSEEILKNQKSLIKLNIDKLNKINNLSKEFIKNCKKNVEIEDFIFQLNETWNLKKNLEKNISNDLITQKINKLKKYGYEGFKLCGAGKGGFIFAVKKTKIPKNLLTNMKRIKIDNDGVVLLFQEK